MVEHKTRCVPPGKKNMGESLVGETKWILNYVGRGLNHCCFFGLLQLQKNPRSCAKTQGSGIPAHWMRPGQEDLESPLGGRLLLHVDEAPVVRLGHLQPLPNGWCQGGCLAWVHFESVETTSPRREERDGSLTSTEEVFAPHPRGNPSQGEKNKLVGALRGLAPNVDWKRDAKPFVVILRKIPTR